MNAIDMPPTSYLPPPEQHSEVKTGNLSETKERTICESPVHIPICFIKCVQIFKTKLFIPVKY